MLRPQTNGAINWEVRLIIDMLKDRPSQRPHGAAEGPLPEPTSTCQPESRLLIW